MLGQQLGTGAAYDARNAERIMALAGSTGPGLETHLPDWVQRVRRKLSWS